MGRFLIQATYTSGAWARMLKIADDRTTAVSDLMESVGGSLEVMYWDVERTTAFVIAYLPDSVAAAAVVTAVTQTGSFTSISAHELLDREQLQDALLLARDSSAVYRVPGQAVLEADGAIR